jgi:hypothetical protein
MGLEPAPTPIYGGKFHAILSFETAPVCFGSPGVLPGMTLRDGDCLAHREDPQFETALNRFNP